MNAPKKSMILQNLQIPHFDVPGVSLPVVPKVALIGKDGFESVLYELNGFRVFYASEVNRIAEFVKSESPDTKWIEEQIVKFGYSKDAIQDAYANLRQDIWKKYWVRSRELLAWPPYSKRLVDIEGLEQESNLPVIIGGHEVKPIEELEDKIRDKFLKEVLRQKLKMDDARRRAEQKIQELKPGKYVILNGNAKAINWPKKDQKIPKELEEELGIRFPTYVWTDPGFEYREGIRSLDWIFEFLTVGGYVGLLSLLAPWLSSLYRGFLLGSLISKE